MQTRTKYVEQLERLEGLTQRLAAKAVADVQALGRALAGDADAVEGVLQGSKAGRRLRGAIEDECLDIMLMQQPLVADDLRLVSGTFRIVSDMAHIDEMARDAAFLAQQVPVDVTAHVGPQLQEAAAKVSQMVGSAASAFLAPDEALARSVFSMDDEVDALYARCEETVVSLIRSGENDARHLPELLMVAKYFERMGDDAQRVAGWAVFRVTGEHALHSGNCM